MIARTVDQHSLETAGQPRTPPVQCKDQSQLTFSTVSFQTSNNQPTCNFLREVKARIQTQPKV